MFLYKSVPFVERKKKAMEFVMLVHIVSAYRLKASFLQQFQKDRTVLTLSIQITTVHDFTRR